MICNQQNIFYFQYFLRCSGWVQSFQPTTTLKTWTILKTHQPQHWKLETTHYNIKDIETMEKPMFHIHLIIYLLCNMNKFKKDYSMKHFHGIDEKYSLICGKHKMVIPKLVEKQIVEWYHNALCHPGETCTELHIAQHFC